MTQKVEQNGSPLPLIIFGICVLLFISMQRQQLPPLPAAEMTTEIPPEQAGVRELHFVVNRSNCERMAKRFRDEGRKVTLVDTKPNPYGHGGFQLRFVCIFEGPEAQPGYFSREKRYEAEHEWHNP